MRSEIEFENSDVPLLPLAVAVIKLAPTTGHQRPFLGSSKV